MSGYSSRSKRLVSLALNNELQKKISSFKDAAKPSTSQQRDSDSDYEPENDSCSSSSSSNSCLNEVINVDTGINVNMIISKILDEIVNSVVETSQKTYTKKGTIRKRKIFNLPLRERKKQKLSKIVESHKVKEPCTQKCQLKCVTKITTERQSDINKQFWALDKNARNNFMFANLKRSETKRNTSGPNSMRMNTFKYFFKNHEGLEINICKIFFLSTLGYEPSNDRVLKTIRKESSIGILTPTTDHRGHHPNKRKIDEEIISNHILSFRPTVAHYRREHSPNRLYLPSDLSATKMFQLFQETYPNIKLGYNVYRQNVKKLNISFAKLGCEECFVCEKHQLHKTESKHDGNNKDCNLCVSWTVHQNKYTTARQEYQKDGAASEKENELFISADLQKVIMLPRAEMFKEVLFIPRIVAFNESFVPIGQNKKKTKPTAVIWHEGIAGRNKEDIISTFHSFILNHRDEELITIWLDNCSAQNKNWALLSFFIYIVNSAEVNLKKITLKFFEPGHTFMSADHFHHQVEKSLKQKAKVFDFNDFKQCVQDANSGKVTVISMDKNNFYNWEDGSSKFKINKIDPRPYLQDMVLISFVRGRNVFSYKTTFEGEDIELNFLKAKHFKNGFDKPSNKSYRGVSLERKENLLGKLRPIIPVNRISFWENLPVSDTPDSDV